MQMCRTVKANRMFNARAAMTSAVGDLLRTKEIYHDIIDDSPFAMYAYKYHLLQFHASLCRLVRPLRRNTEMEEQSGKEWIRGAVIGAGSFGTVSTAIHKRDGHLFAVKSTQDSISSMQNEHRILQSLDSPYVVRCLGRDFTHENGLPTFNLFLEYMPIGSIADLLKKFKGPFEESIVRSYTRSILRGIQYLHSQGIVHCDIKASNILVAPSAIKLADFGSAKRMNDEAALPLRGTLLWMAPEVLNQQEHGPPSDIWSLGCTVLEMATGKHPWAHISHPLAAIYRIASTHDLPEVPPSFSPQARDFLEKCFRRDPKQRWTAAQLLTHPFLNNDLCSKEDIPVSPPQSPTSVLDHRALQPWDSCSSTFSEALPVLPLSKNLPAATRRGGCDKQEGRAADEQCPRPSPRQRMIQLAAGGGMQRPDWFPSPSAQWIVVKSPQINSSGSLNGSFLKKLPSTKGNPEVNSEADNYAQRQSFAVPEKCLESQISVTENQCGSLYSTVIQPSRSHLPNCRPVTTEKADQHQELCLSFSQIFNCQDFRHCILVARTADLCGFHDQLVSSTPGGGMSPLCYSMCTVALSCKRNTSKSHLYNGGRSNNSACNCFSQIIQVHFHRPTNWRADQQIETGGGGDTPTNNVGNQMEEVRTRQVRELLIQAEQSTSCKPVKHTVPANGQFIWN